MSQYDFGTIDPATKSGSELATDLNAWRTALISSHKGSSRPSYAIAGTIWEKDVSSSSQEFYFFDGTDDILLWTVDVTGNAISFNNSGGLTASTLGLGAGSAGSPSLFRSTDTDTGLFFPAANSLAASVGGSEIWRATSTGLGIGTTPAALLHISAASAEARINAPSGNPFASFYENGTRRTYTQYDVSSNYYEFASEETGAVMRWLLEGSARMTLTASGVLNATGNVQVNGVNVLVSGTHSFELPSTGMINGDAGALTAVGTINSSPYNKGLTFDPSTRQNAYFNMRMPSSWNLGSIKSRFLWTAASGSGVVRWGFSARCNSDGDTLTTAFSSSTTVDDTFLGANELHASGDATYTPENTPASGDWLSFWFYRDAASGSDTFTANAVLLGVELLINFSGASDT